MNYKVLATFLIIAIVSIGSFTNVYAQNEHENAGHNETEKFDAGSFIIDHIGDSHEWHIVTWGKTHVSLPLPVILYSQVSGWHLFSSGKLAHAHTYNNFKLVTSGNNKGKIIELLEESTIQAELPEEEFLALKEKGNAEEMGIYPLDIS
ncbi:MAG: hypothetical protein KAI79_00155, partial [Bacteroidales bacterium]|nr:hypothetical protein [Bacteroidales bacterium]